MRPPFPYYGGKMTIADRIVAVLPEHGHYVEPFAGSLAVLLAKPPARMETVNDLDDLIVTFWQVLRDRPDELAQACALTPHSRTEHARALDIPPDLDDVEKARRVWVRLTQGRSGAMRPTGWRNYQDPGGSVTSMPGYLAGYVDRMPPAARRLACVSLECRDALDVITTYGKHRGVLLYCDPPYPYSTRGGSHYRHEMGKREQHEQLAEALNACTAAVVLSGYRSQLYDRLYAGWHTHEISAFTGNGGDRRAGTRVEVLWSNRPLRAQTALDLAEVTA